MSPPPLEQASSAEQARWFAEEVHPHEPALRAWLRSRYPQLGDVDDVLHESYLSLLRRHPAGGILLTKAYLFAVVRNAALKVFRKRRIYSDVPVNELPEWRLLDGGPDVAESVNHRQVDMLVAEAITLLPPRCGEIITLRVVNGLTCAEIAEQLQLSEATIRVQLARGMKKCSQFLRERGVGLGS